MKKRLLLTLLLATFSLLRPSAQEYVSPESILPAHPRLLLTPHTEKRILETVDRDTLWTRIHRSLIDESERMLVRPVKTYHVEGRRLLATSREVLRRVFFLAYSYRTTGQVKYAERAEAEMLAAAAFPDWNPSHFLDVAEMTLALAIGYDWLFDTLSETARTTIAEAILKKGLEPAREEQYSWFYRQSNNWNQVCNAGLTFGALAIFEQSPATAAGIINRAIATVTLPMKEYAPDGAYPEGVGYWEYGTAFNVLLLEALEQLFGSDFGLTRTPGFLETGLYSQHMITPAGNVFCYADSDTRLGFMPTVFWFHKATGNPALLWAQRQALETGDPASVTHHRLLPLAMLWGAANGAPLSRVPEPETRCWHGQGSTPVCTMRTSWSDPDALFLGFKAGSPSTNHGHMDVGSFYIEADRVKWALELGMEPYDAVEKAGVDLWNKSQNSQRWDVYRLNNFAHNTLTFNDRKQRVEGQCRLDEYVSEPDRTYAVSDLTAVCPPWIQQSVRAVALADSTRVVVEDRITTRDRFTKMRWNMMTQADECIELGDNRFLLKKGKAKLYVRVEAPVKVRYHHTPAIPTNSYDSPNEGVYAFGFEAELPLQTTCRFTVFLMPRTEQPVDGWRHIL